MTSTESVDSSALVVAREEAKRGVLESDADHGRRRAGAGRQLQRLRVAGAAHLPGLVPVDHRCAAQLPRPLARLEGATRREVVVGRVAPRGERLAGGLRRAVGRRRDQEPGVGARRARRRVRRSRARRRERSGGLGSSCIETAASSALSLRTSVHARWECPSIEQTSIRRIGHLADRASSDAHLRGPPTRAHPCRGAAPRVLGPRLPQAAARA